MKGRWTQIAVVLWAGAARLAGGEEVADARPAGGGLAQSVAGGVVELGFAPPLDSLSVQIGYVPVSCRLDEARKRATCDVPNSLGPGIWPVDAEVGRDGRYASHRLVVELRVPSITGASRVLVGPGDTVDLDLEAPLPMGEELKVVFRGERGEANASPQQVISSRLRVRVPVAELGGRPVLRLRVRDMESAPFQGLVVSRAFGYLQSWVSLLVPGLLVGGLIAAMIALSQPARARRR